MRGRKQYVDFNGIQSSTAYIGSGVPQGSLLGPLLFMIYMNDIHSAGQNINVTLYADNSNQKIPLCSFYSSLHINKASIKHVSDQIKMELVILSMLQNMNVNMVHTCSSSRNITKKMIMINYKINIHISIENTYSANTIENTYSARTISHYLFQVCQLIQYKFIPPYSTGVGVKCFT